MPPIEEASGETGAKDTTALGGGDAATAEANAAKAEADKALAQKDMTPEQKAADDKAREDAAKGAKDGKDADKDKAGAPDKYEDFKGLEGIEIDPEIMTEAQALFKEAKLPQALAQKFVDVQGKLMAKVAETQSKAWNELTGGWEKSLKVDKEFGGAKYEEHRATANKVIAKFADKEGKLVEALETTRMGNHPELFRLLWNIGKAMGEDKLTGEGEKGGVDGTKKPLAERMYPNQNPG